MEVRREVEAAVGLEAEVSEWGHRLEEVETDLDLGGSLGLGDQSNPGELDHIGVCRGTQDLDQSHLEGVVLQSPGHMVVLEDSSRRNEEVEDRSPEGGKEVGRDVGEVLVAVVVRAGRNSRANPDSQQRSRLATSSDTWKMASSIRRKATEISTR